MFTIMLFLIRYTQQMEWQPDHFFRRQVQGFWFDNLKAAAKFLGAKPENLVFVENATTGQ